MKKSTLIRPFNLEESEAVARGKTSLRKLKTGGIFGKSIKSESEYFFDKELVHELMASVSNFEGFRVHPIISEKGNIVVYLEPVGSGVGPIPGPGVGTSPAT